MNFQLTEAQRQLREEARSYAQEVIRPQAIELDQAEEHPTEILDELGERGYAGITVSEEHGGMSEGPVELAILTEELSAALMPVASALALHLGVAEVIERFGTDEQRIGPVGEGYVQRGKLQTGINVPARGVGIARAALDDTVEYTSEREQAGQRIGDRQGVRWEVGEMAQRVDTARLLTYRAAARADRGAETTREFSMAKISATQAAVDNANTAMQLHGGIGYTTEKHVERYLRDAKLLTLAGGPNEGHKDTLGEAVYAEHPRE